ncbi:hypothetical protein BN1723_013938 [Verticillium longisporum]|uniref:BRCT domain-containing protein n=2 Tax=Verticillium TaxID=1036719 RepID=A0A0G4LIL3_VERLO|nr:predicted protein [Verticillium alfalfae VaMs.102]EEY23998.1 predicted protein [Verticillium alfalfae VaMs.102]CRK21545.1 hypothetical protein BN1708_013160 [Verticillium longisporum]CRK27141.1 hypothetical protein BN1723_013938 [Verticillium longisporum]
MDPVACARVRILKSQRLIQRLDQPDQSTHSLADRSRGPSVVDEQDWVASGRLSQARTTCCLIRLQVEGVVEGIVRDLIAKLSIQLTKLWIRSLGGTYQNHVGSTTTHICIDPSQYYSSSHDVRRARERHIFLVTLGWLQDSYALGKFVDSCDYDLAELCGHAAPLRGCVIAFTSSYPRPRGIYGFKLVEDNIVSLGGLCDQDSEPIHTLTHLCATEEEIRHQGIYVRNVLHRARSEEDKSLYLVNHQWLAECLRQGRRVEEDLDALPLTW